MLKMHKNTINISYTMRMYAPIYFHFCRLYFAFHWKPCITKCIALLAYDLTAIIIIKLA